MRIAVFLFAYFLCLAAHAVEPQVQTQAKPIQWDQLSEDDLRILQVKLDKYELEDVITAYQLADGIYIPLGLFSQITGLAIQTSPEKGFAEGFILDENRHFILDVARREITVSGQTSILGRSSMISTCMRMSIRNTSRSNSM